MQLVMMSLEVFVYGVLLYSHFYFTVVHFQKTVFRLQVGYVLLEDLAESVRI